MQSVVSVRGQTVVPKEVREALAIEPGTKLIWRLRNGGVMVYAIPKDPVRASMGALKDSGYTFAQFMKERQEERERERRKDEEEERRWRDMFSTRPP